ncbi:hypothetical protein HDU93_008495 [Gonapodya sp. JEL0774]|nr:hypothetical protein HDU93_008495 [Gonapodya sp. JEL0774]
MIATTLDPNMPHEAISAMAQWAFAGQGGWLHRTFCVKGPDGQEIRLWQRPPGTSTLGRDVRIQVSPKASRDLKLMPTSNGDKVHVTTRLHKVTRSFMQFSCEYRLIEKRDRKTRRQRVARFSPDQVEPFAVGLLGVVFVSVGPPPNRFKSAALPATLHGPGWISTSPALASGDYDWITRSDLDLDKMGEEELRSGGWAAQEEFLWKARWSDTDGLRHVTTTKRPLPALDLIFERFRNFRDFANIEAFYISLSSEVHPGDLVRVESVQRSEIETASDGKGRPVVELRMAIVNGHGQRHAAGARIVDVLIEDPARSLL